MIYPKGTRVRLNIPNSVDFHGKHGVITGESHQSSYPMKIILDLEVNGSRNYICSLEQLVLEQILPEDL